MFTKEEGVISYNSLEALVGFEINPEKYALFALQWREGPDEPISYYEAKDWVASLGESWRMPTLSELRSLWIAGIKGDDMGCFVNGNSFVWSGEVRDLSSAWGFHFAGGAERWRYRGNSDCARAFAVRNINNNSVSSGAISLERRKNERKNS